MTHVTCLGKRKIYENIHRNENIDGREDEEENIDSRTVTLLIITLLCTILLLIVIYQSFKICKSVIRLLIAKKAELLQNQVHSMTDISKKVSYFISRYGERRVEQ